MAKTYKKEEYKYGFYDGDVSVLKLPKGHSEEVVREISRLKDEPEWMLDIRLKAYRKFLTYDLPTFGPDLSNIDLDDISYYVKPSNAIASSWDDVPEKIRKTFERLKVSKEEQEWLGGLATQYDSEMVYKNSIEELEKQGVIFCSTDEAVKNHPEIVKKYFSSLVNEEHNMFAALNTAFWSGGTFVYVPKDAKVERTIQSYFRINARGAGQFERTLLIVEDGGKLDYAEGCTAPTFTLDALHAAVVEVFVGKDSSCKYTTIQNWADNVINLVTKSAVVETNGSMEWIDGNLGSKLNMKYPSTILKGDYSRGLCLSIALAMGKGVIQDAGAKMIHIGKYTNSTILSKSISGFGGEVNYRGIVNQLPSAIGSKSKVECDTMILDANSKSDTIPTNIVANSTSSIEHEAVVSKMSERQIYYLMSRGLSEDKAREAIIMGFVEPFAREIPMEYAVELNDLIAMELESNIG